MQDLPNSHEEPVLKRQVPATDFQAGLWNSRARTIRALCRILKAEWLIRRRSMSLWRDSLGKVLTSQAAMRAASTSVTPQQASLAADLARSCERAARRLPYSPKCLPMAMALQWKLRDEGIPARLVIASQIDASPEVNRKVEIDRHHAWVELDGEMILGQCDRRSYRPVLAFCLASEQANVLCVEHSR